MPTDLSLPSKLVTEDWKKEYEKIILTRKYARACDWLGVSSTTPTLENVKRLYGLVVDYVSAMPLPNNPENVDKRRGFVDKLDNVGLILFGVSSDETRKLEKEYKVIKKKSRVGGKLVDVIQNIPNLIKVLRDILIEAGEFATTVGLRVTLADRRKFGTERLLEEEDFKDLEFE